MVDSGAPEQVVRIGGGEHRWGARTLVMGIINVTPDSFSGDGTGDDVEAAVARGRSLWQDGADILDVGGESSRPADAARREGRVAGAVVRRSRPVSADEELWRVIPVVERLVREVPLPVSVDTYRPEVARRALEAGAAMLNDIWGTADGGRISAVAAERGVPVVLMHNRSGRRYGGDPVEEVTSELSDSRDRALELGVPGEHVILDPGFGFGKSARGNLELLRRLADLRRLGQPLLIGTSRKSTIGLVLGLPVEERIEGTAATVALAIAQGVDIVRVHDVREMARVAAMADAVVRGWVAPPRTA